MSAQALADRSVPDEEVARTVVDEGDKGSGADGLETDDASRFYVTAYEHNSVLRRMPDGSFETLVHDPRPTTRAGKTAGRSRTRCSAS